MSSTSSSIQISPQTLSVDVLLKQHATAPDPKTTALEQAVNDRNVLSSQNAQLWKLIEKQRAGYNQILKELERIRGERDGYKSKLLSLGALPSSERRQKRSIDRASRPSIDLPTNGPSPSQTHNRFPVQRHNSDDSGHFAISVNFSTTKK
jgi:RalA-binding protein 1